MTTRHDIERAIRAPSPEHGDMDRLRRETGFPEADAVVMLTDAYGQRKGARLQCEPYRMREMVAQGIARWDRPFDQVKTGRRKATARTKG